MDFTLDPVAENYRRRIRAFVEQNVLPLEEDPSVYDDHENIRDEILMPLREKAKAAGLWALQSSKEMGGHGLGAVARAACYEEMGRSIFGAVTFNCAAPDDGNMMLLDKVATPAQKEKY